jgi:hypothetical protein
MTNQNNNNCYEKKLKLRVLLEGLRIYPCSIYMQSMDKKHATSWTLNCNEQLHSLTALRFGNFFIHLYSFLTVVCIIGKISNLLLLWNQTNETEIEDK